MSKWIKDKVFNDADSFINWLDSNFGDFITKHINDNHVHHTWKPDHSSNKSNSTLQLHRNMRNYHVNTNGWQDIAQNITIGSDGIIVTGRDIAIIPVSAKGYNGTTAWHPFAYEMIGNFDKGNDILDGKQLESAIKISRYFYKKGKGIVFHRECLINGRVPKTCPGTGIEKNWFMNLVKDPQFDVGKKPSNTKPSPSTNVNNTNKENVKSANYLQKGDKGSKVRTMQEKLIKAGYKLTKFGADSHFGDETLAAVKTLQKKHGLIVDGLFGTQSNKALENDLKSKSKPATDTVKGDMKTTSIVTYLNSIKVDSSFANRKKLAEANGIKGYKGTAQQNTLLLSKLRKSGVTPSKPVTTAKPNPIQKPSSTNTNGDMKTTSIVTYLNSVKVDSSFNNRKKLAISNGIKNYTGTATQNTQLLNKLRQGNTVTKPTPVRSKPKKSIAQMATEVIAGKHSNGHVNRQKSLGISDAEYKKVKTEVNRRLK